MVNSGTSLIHPTVPPTIQPLNQSDLLLIERVREELVQRGINPPSWREADSEKRRRFYDEVRSILIDQGENRSVRQSQCTNYHGCIVRGGITRSVAA